MPTITVSKPQARLIEAVADGTVSMVSKTKAEIVDPAEAVQILTAIAGDGTAARNERKVAEALVAKVSPFVPEAAEVSAMDAMVAEWEAIKNGEPSDEPVVRASVEVVETNGVKHTVVSEFEPVESGKRPFVMVAPGKRQARFATLESAEAWVTSEVEATGTTIQVIDELAGRVHEFRAA